MSIYECTSFIETKFNFKKNNNVSELLKNKSWQKLARLRFLQGKNAAI